MNIKYKRPPHFGWQERSWRQWAPAAYRRPGVAIRHCSALSPYPRHVPTRGRKARAREAPRLGPSGATLGSARHRRGTLLTWSLAVGQTRRGENPTPKAPGTPSPLGGDHGRSVSDAYVRLGGMAAATVLRPCHSKRSSSSGRPWMGAAAPVAPGPAVLEAAPGPSGPAGACGPGGGWAGGGLPPSGDGAAMAAAPSAASARSWPERLLDVVFCPPCKIQAYGRHMTLGKPEKPGARNSHESPRRTEVQEACLAWRLSWRLAWPGLAWHRLHGLAWPHGLAWLGQARPRLASPRFASPRLPRLL